MKLNYDSGIVTTSDKDKFREECFSKEEMEEAEKNVARIQELLAEAIFQYCKKNKLKLK